MKTKILNQIKILLTLMATLFLTNTDLFAQEWEEKEPNIIYAVDEDEDMANVKVGIGTADPQEKLDVVGNLRVRGRIIADDMDIKGFELMRDTIQMTKYVTIEKDLHVKGGIKVGESSLAIGETGGIYTSLMDLFIQSSPLIISILF